MTVAVHMVGRRLAVPWRLPVLAAGLVHGQSLDDAVPGQHAAVYGKAPADHESPHGRVLTREYVRFVCQVGLVLATIHKHETGPAVTAAVVLVLWVRPPTTPAEAYK